MRHVRLFEGRSAVTFWLTYFGRYILPRLHDAPAMDVYADAIRNAILEFRQNADDPRWQDNETNRIQACLEAFSEYIAAARRGDDESIIDIEVTVQVDRSTKRSWVQYKNVNAYVRLQMMHDSLSDLGVIVEYKLGERWCGIEPTNNEFLRLPELLDASLWSAALEEWKAPSKQ